MGSRGPGKKHPIIQKLEGNPSKRVIEEIGIEATGEPFIPEHLVDDARGCMEVIMRSMPPRVYAAMDSFVLASFAKAWALHKEAAHKIAAPGFAHVTEDNKINAWIKILNQQAMLLATLGDRLGLNPRARLQIKLPEPGKRASKFDGLIGHSGSSPSLNA